MRQPTLVVGAAYDPLEGEAERTADLVMRRLTAQTAAADDRPSILRSPGNTTGAIGAEGGATDRSTERAIMSGRGVPLDPSVRSSMEGAFGTDFSQVRVHTGSRSDDLNQRLAARAFTTGNDIFVRSVDYAPRTSAGQRLLAHELTHVMQQTVSRSIEAKRPRGVLRRGATDVAIRNSSRLVGPRQRNRSSMTVPRGFLQRTVSLDGKPMATVADVMEKTNLWDHDLRQRIEQTARKNKVKPSPALKTEASNAVMQLIRSTDFSVDFRTEDSLVDRTRNLSKLAEAVVALMPALNPKTGATGVAAAARREPTPEQLLYEKQRAVVTIMSKYVPLFRKLDPKAQLCIRGSLASGIKGPEKLDDDDQRQRFDPRNFDIDAYVVSNLLFEQALETERGAAAARNGKMPGTAHGGVGPIVKQLARALASVPGNRDAKPKQQYKFNVYIRTETSAAGVRHFDAKDARSVFKDSTYAGSLFVPDAPEGK